MPVGTVAQAMVNDSYKQFSSPQTGATNNFITLDNRAIYQSAEVILDHIAVIHIPIFIL